MLVQSDQELSGWIYNALDNAGDFLRSVCSAALRADDDNYAILRPALLQLKEKYPRYVAKPEVQA